MKAKRPAILVTLVVGLLLFSIGTFQAKSGSSSATYLSMQVVDNPTGFTPQVTSDGVNGGVYKDYHLTGGDKCVSAPLNNKGGTVVQQNYLISMSHGQSGSDVWCNNAQPTGFKPRYWNITIEDQLACQTIFGSSFSASSCTFPADAGASFTNADYEEISIAVSSSSSQVVMQFTLGGRAYGYGVRTDSNATTTTVLTNPLTRQATYNGTAQLYHAGEPTGTGSFPFVFQLVFEEF